MCTRAVPTTELSKLPAWGVWQELRKFRQRIALGGMRLAWAVRADCAASRGKRGTNPYARNASMFRETSYPLSSRHALALPPASPPSRQHTWRRTCASGSRARTHACSNKILRLRRELSRREVSMLQQFPMALGVLLQQLRFTSLTSILGRWKMRRGGMRKIRRRTSCQSAKISRPSIGCASCTCLESVWHQHGCSSSERRARCHRSWPSPPARLEPSQSSPSRLVSSASRNGLPSAATQRSGLERRRRPMPTAGAVRRASRRLGGRRRGRLRRKRHGCGPGGRLGGLHPRRPVAAALA